MSRFKKLAPALIAVALLAIVGVYLFNSNRDTQTNTEDSSVLGESSSLDYSVKIVSANEVKVGDIPYGMKVIRVVVDVNNNTGSPLLFSPGLQTFVKSSAGTVYNYTANYSDGQQIGGEIKPGQNYKVDLDFELPKQADPAQFIFQKDAQARQITADI